MKNFKQIAFGALVCALAISFSAFTKANNDIKVTKLPNGKLVITAFYYNKSGVAGDQTPSNFIFRDGTTLAACSSSTTLECKAQWTTANMPHNSDSPTDAGSPVYVGNQTFGDYNNQ